MLGIQETAPSKIIVAMKTVKTCHCVHQVVNYNVLKT